jgi:hypothetical protein
MIDLLFSNIYQAYFGRFIVGLLIVSYLYADDCMIDRNVWRILGGERIR